MQYKKRHKAIAACLTLSFVLVSFIFGTIPLAHADVRAEDVIGNMSVSQRGLSVTQAPDISASYGALVTPEGTVLWSRGAPDSSSIASTTKIMTAVVAMENASLDMQITIPDEAAATGESSSNLVAGTTTTLLNLLHGMLIESGNDAAVAISIGVSGSESAFVELMNAKAAELGMTNTVFENPHGLEEGDHHSCAADMTILVRYAMKKQAFRDIVCLSEAWVDLGYGETHLESTNELLTSYSGAIGVKTGFTDEAGYCLVSAAARDGIELYAVMLGCSSASGRFSASSAIYDWGFAHYKPLVLSDTTKVIAKIPSLSWVDESIPVSCKEAHTVNLLDYNGSVSQYISYADVTGSVATGDVLGTITWTQNGVVIATSPLVATVDCPAPSFFESIGIWFVRTFTGGPDHAEFEVLVDPPVLVAPY